MIFVPNETFEIQGQVFVWDRDKNLSNIEKHGISFKNAAWVFFDPFAVAYDDEQHSQDEDRFMIIGLDEKQKLLTVFHCYKEADSVLRIISARKASKTEKELYGGAF
jgi:hypothetical protein